MKMYVSTPMIRHWIGDDHLSTQELLELIGELVNGKYKPEEMRADVLDLWEDTV